MRVVLKGASTRGPCGAFVRTEVLYCSALSGPTHDVHIEPKKGLGFSELGPSAGYGDVRLWLLFTGRCPAGQRTITCHRFGLISFHTCTSASCTSAF